MKNTKIQDSHNIKNNTKCNKILYYEVLGPKK